MKFHWGHGILIALILIVITFSTALILSFTDEKNHQLVAEDYYAKELAFQDQIDQGKNAKSEGRVLEIEQLETGLKVTVSGISTLPTSSNVELMRPSDEAFDLTAQLSEDGTCLFSSEQLKRGKYLVKVNWVELEKSYYLEKQIFVQ